MANLKRYTVKEDWKDFTVLLEVDHDILTVENATMQNDFWSGGAEFKRDEGGSVVRAVIRHFGAKAIQDMLGEGGASFAPGHPAAEIWSKQIRDDEGWGGETEDASPFGWLGIRVVSADVEAPGFDDVELQELLA